MNLKALQILSSFIILISLTRCAQIIPLSGGKRDVTPPVLLSTEPINKTINFSSNSITLNFNEFIVLKDLNNHLIINPKFKSIPEITVEGKKIKINLKDEVLLPNTTYRFFFGSAITDITEGNQIQDCDYVFSTGGFIDSLLIKGVVLEAFDNKPSENVLIGLYTKTENKDSTVFKSLPNYISKSNANGAFVFKNLPSMLYKIYGFTDKNKNNLYDGEPEKIAFLNGDVHLISDTNIKLNLFEEEPTKLFVKKIITPYYGLIQIILNKKSNISLNTLNLKYKNNIYETSINKEKDTIISYYKGINDSLELLLNNLTIKRIDTLKIKLPKINLYKNKLRPFTTNTLENNLSLNTSLKLNFLNWMDTTNYNLLKIKLSSKEDTQASKIKIKGRWLSINTFEILNKLNQGINYTLKIDTTAFFDLLGIKNDSLICNFKTKDNLEFGKIKLKLLVNNKQHYILQLINNENKVVKEKNINVPLSSTNSINIEFNDVSPGTYHVKLIYDSNENKKWDTGNLFLKKQAEVVHINSKQLKVISNWEIEEDLIIKD